MARKKERWFIPTNTENLKMIIAQGLISSPDGFKKYYRDILELQKGYIPLFKEEVHQDVFTYVLSEVDGLKPVLLEIDLKKIEMTIEMRSEEGLENIFFIQAPLPLSVISSLIFQSQKDKIDFEEDSKLYSNVVLAELKRSSTIIEQNIFTKKLFSSSIINTIKDLDLKAIDKIAYKKVYAYGGLLANLFYFSKNGSQSHDKYTLFSDWEKENAKEAINVYDYLYDFERDESNIKRKMDDGLIEIMIYSEDLKEDILAFLESDTWDERTKKRTEELANTLRLFESYRDKSVSEQFEEAKTALERILLMLFLREDSESLMEYTLELFDEEDYVNFAMMFGMRDKFVKIPKELREFKGLQNYISMKMAEYAQQSISDKIIFNSLPRPLSIMDMLNTHRLKKRVIKALNIESCIQTIMPNRDYTHSKGKNTYVGFIEPEYKLLEDLYFETISKKKLSKEEYNKFLKI